MDQYLQIRLLHRDGQSIRQIAKRLGHSRATARPAGEELGIRLVRARVAPLGSLPSLPRVR